MLPLFEHEPVIPVGEVLYAGHAVREGLFDRQAKCLLPSLVIRLGNVRLDQRQGRCLAKDPGWLPISCVVDFATVRIRGLGCHRSSQQCGAIRDGNVPIYPDQKRWVPARNGIEIGTGRQGFRRPGGVIPASAHDPLTRSCFGNVGANPVLHLREGACSDQVNTEPLLPCLCHVRMRVIETWHDKGAMKVDDGGLRALQCQDCVVVSGGDHAPTAHGEGVHPRRQLVRIFWPEVRAGQDVAVKEQGIGWRLLGDQGRGSRQAEQESGGAHQRAAEPGQLEVVHATSLPEQTLPGRNRLAPFLSNGRTSVQEQQQDAAERQLASCRVIPLPGGVQTATCSPRSDRKRGDAQ